MSATGRGAVRVEKDFYPTPQWVTNLIIPHIDWSKVHALEEPARGRGDLLNALPHTGKAYCHEITEGWDYLKGDLEPVDLVITNPPYNLAAEFLARSLEQARCVVYLLRISFLGSAKRRDFLQRNRPTHLYTLSERPSFVDVCGGIPTSMKGCGAVYQKSDAVKRCVCGGHVKAGTDATEYAWVCWDRGDIMRDPPGMYFL